MLILIHDGLRKLRENAAKSQQAESLADYPVDILSIQILGGGGGYWLCKCATVLPFTQDEQKAIVLLENHASK